MAPAQQLRGARTVEAQHLLLGEDGNIALRAHARIWAPDIGERGDEFPTVRPE